MALLFHGTEQKTHSDKITFNAINGGNFASLYKISETANLKLTIFDQKSYCECEGDAIYPVTNTSREQGWTTFKLSEISKKLMFEALHKAYSNIISPRPNS